ncbi:MULTISPECIES: YqeB family protein [Paenibacillus]|uniref:YqeB family protein n=1 Tax=Paenibacillus TaxID=44249 RepID=UPI0004913313|nr:hypothetical protein [Paenibacillus sp. IHBB 10380]
MDKRTVWTELGLSTVDKMLIWAIPPVLGGVLGWFLPVIAEWASSLPWVPFQGPLELVASLHGPWVALITALLGLLAGMWLSHAAIRESLHVRLSDRELQLSVNGAEAVYTREDIFAAFLDGKELVLVGQQGQELYRQKIEGKARLFTEEFLRHGYPWREGDPYADEYRRWVANSPELTAAMNALFEAREKALREDDKDDADDLRRELSKLGVTVRDEGKRQYWRLHGSRL